MSGIEFTGPLRANLKAFPEKMHRGLTAIMAFEAPRAEAEMKQNASWNDQTGNARGGLTARPFARKGRSYGIDLSHGVPYGIWLEVRFSGRYAIIGPTIQSFGPQVMSTAATLFGRL